MNDLPTTVRRTVGDPRTASTATLALAAMAASGTTHAATTIPATGPGLRGAAPLAAGTRLQEFEIRSVIGQGGFGIVYLAEDTALHREVAIKEYMPAHLAGRDEGVTVAPLTPGQADTYALGLQGFLEEARMLARFKHPGLLSVLRCWEENGTAYMVMPYYEGETLGQYLKDHPGVATEAWLKHTLRPLIDALEQMHAEACFHRDVAPDNILILRDGSAVLLDLGAARRAIADDVQAMTVMLKPGFAPIEQYSDDPRVYQGPWTDIYALAAVMYYCLAGRAPPASATRVMRDSVSPLAELKPEGYSAGFLAAIDLGLSLQPEDRPRSIAQFRALIYDDPPDTLSDAATRRQLAWRAIVSASRTAAGRLRSTQPSDADELEALEPRPTMPPSTSPEEWAGFGSGPMPAPAAQRRPDPLADLARATTAAGDGTDRWLHHVGAGQVVIAASVLLAVAAAAWQTWGPSAQGSGAARPDAALEAAIAGSVDTGSPPQAAPAALPPNRQAGIAATDRAPAAVAAAAEVRAVDVALARAAASSRAASAGGTAAAPRANTRAATDGSGRPAARDEARAGAIATGSAGTGIAGAVATAVPAAARTADATVPPGQAELTLAIKPWAEVRVDGVSRGVAPPLRQLILPPGRHDIELRNPAAPPVRLQVTVRAGEKQTLEHRF